ncbi:MAG TPA: class I adenylate-forming enzyme family protein [Burkholderiaceae bacterium]|nr:class I adenylate-forming enzyme family protein [Burkholderiaceae bacterium]
MFSRTFRNIADVVREHAAARPHQPALVQGDQKNQQLTFAELDALMDRVAVALQRDGVRVGDVIALCGSTTPQQAAVFLGALRAGAVVAPLAASVTPAIFASMLRDAGARLLFVDASAAALVPGEMTPRCIALGAGAPGKPFDEWLAAPGTQLLPVTVEPESPFNLIYSSGTTGTPKGVVQPHVMRWMHMLRGTPYGYGPDAVTILATPLYSNTTLVAFFPALGLGGTVVLLAKFDAAAYLALAELYCATHTMLVPVQYQRIMALPDFGRHDLSSFRMKFSTSAPFSAALKADVLARWPGGLVEFYGMTEGGGTCILEAHRHPDKLHTVGRPAEGHDIRLIDDDGCVVPVGAAGEVVGHSPTMMTGYHNQPQRTREAEWYAPDGKRFIRTGDVGRFDAEGFLTLFDRKKDMIISGGFNIYSSDLEVQLLAHAAVDEAAVVGVPSVQWGETPVAFVVRDPQHDIAAADLREWINARVGKTQRVHDLICVDELPRNSIGKILKRELRERYLAGCLRAVKKETR